MNNTINWELRVTQTEYTGSNDPFDGTCDPTVRSLLHVNGVAENEGWACKSWACTAPCLNTELGGWWTGTDYPASISMAVYSVAFESDNADGCVYTDGDDHYWAGYFTFRDGLTDMPFLYSSTDFTPCRWIDELGTGGTPWLMPNTAEFDQRMQLAWRRTHGEYAYDRLDLGTIAMNTQKIDVNSNLDLPEQNGSARLEYSNREGDPSKDVYYKFNIAQASKVTINTEHPLTTFDTKVYLTDLDGREFTMDNDGGGNTWSRIVAHLPPGTYGIRVEGNGSASGRFHLAVVVQAPEGQPGVPISDTSADHDYLSFRILGDPGSCNPQSGYRYSVLPSGTAWGSSSGTDPNKYFNLPGGNGPRTFNADIIWGRNDGVSNAVCDVPNWQVFIDGQVCTSCAVTTVPLSRTQCVVSGAWRGAYGIDRISVTHYAGDSWDRPDQAREFAIRDLNRNVDIRFKALMVGTSFTSVLGYFDAPQAPLYILRDPPGDQSYSSITSSTESCFGQTYSVSTDASTGVWAKARVGTEGSVGLLGIVETDYEIYGEVGVDLTMGRTETANREYVTCLSTESEFTTPLEGAPDDVFIGSAIRYAYGMSKSLSRNGCASARDAALEIVPMEVISSYNYTESHIRSTVIPQLQGWLDQLEPGTAQYRDVANQLSIWHQTLAMNDEINAGAPLEINRAFNGGGNGQSYTLTQTTSAARTIDYSVYLDAGISAEFGAFIGGSGVAVGGELRMRSEMGRGASGSNQTTNTMTYHLEDDDASDNFNVGVRRDAVFGTYAFSLAEEVTASSCPYEGGYRLDQPSLSVGSAGNTSMIVSEAPIGSQVNFPLIICNASDRVRSYYLKFRSNTNTEGGILEAFGNVINGNDDGVFLEDLDPGECLTANLTLTQPNPSVLDFEDIEVYVYTLCEPEIRSAVNISAYFGEGNVNTDPYCTPTSYGDVIYGHWIDGVQLRGIDNTGSGPTPVPDTHVDHTVDMSTGLSLNSQEVLRVTSGTSGGGTRFAAWIDYDRNGLFEETEKLGETTSSTSGEAIDMPFTVPGSALTGTTRLRVRAAYVFDGDPTPLDPCYGYAYGEIEDYGIVIDANTPIDCQGTPNGAAHPGTSCDDGNALTGSDTYDTNCNCVGTPLDCAGNPGGSALPGTACDDNDPATVGDIYDATCACIGTATDCEGLPGGSALPGTPCDDGDPGTDNDLFGPDCTCAGELIDCLGVAGGSALPNTPCDDGNPLSSDDTYNVFCQCVGTLTEDCLGVAGGTAQPGTACDDNDPDTGSDTYGSDCICAGLPLDCNGTPGGTALPGVPCDDLNPQTNNDVYAADCICAGTLLGNDCAGVPGGPAQPGTPCDDGNADTGNDVYNAFCNCSGQLIDCLGTVGGNALPGLPCNDGNAATGNDVYMSDCACVGLVIDCTGMPGGSSLPGTPCNDENPSTSNDMWNANCICAGTLANDCNGTPGGTAQPGTPCNDNDATTGNDVYGTDCICAGVLIDCNGVAGGPALVGTPCDDEDACTSGDVWSVGCGCAGTPTQIGTISGQSIVDGWTTNTFHITPVAGASAYSWTLPAGWSSTNTTDFVLIASSGNSGESAQLCVDAFVGGCVLSTCLNITQQVSIGVTENAMSEQWLQVQPNPSNGVFHIIPSKGSTDRMRISVHDGLGREVVTSFTLPLERAFPLDMGAAASGAYYLVATRNGEQQVLKLLVQH